MSLVKYQVERRPIGDDGHVYRGLEGGDYILVKTKHNAPYGKAGKVSGQGGDMMVQLLRPQDPLPEYKKIAGYGENEAYTHFREVPGEPWVVVSTHYSIESALEVAAPIAAAIGADNVRIVQVLSHTTIFKLQ